MASVGTVVIEVDANTAKLVKGIKQSNDQISKLQRSATQAKDSIANFAKAAAGIYVVAKAWEMAKAAVSGFMETSAEFEQYEATLKAITGSSEQAKQSMAWVQDFASKTPFSINKVTESFVKMKAYGLDPMDGTLTTLGDTAAAMGKDINQAVEAMADAVTGENERLKEFGIKASKTGNQIAYSWSDSSGKMRNISIKNNKDIIQSTLNAIWNEKYIGAMAEQANTWNGMMSNIGDSWTIFKKEFMDAGLFAYIKSLANVISTYLRAGFSDAKNGAKDFSDGFIGYINGAIRAVGLLKDVISGIKLVASAVGYAVLFMSKAVMQAINLPISAMNKLVDGYNALGDVIGYAKAKAFEPFIDTSWTDKTMKSLKDGMSSTWDELANNSGQKLAEVVILKTKQGLAGVNSELDKLSSQKADAKATLDALGAGYGGLADAAGKGNKATNAANKAAKKAASDAKKAAREAKKLADKAAKDALKAAEQAAQYAEDFKSSIDGSLTGMFDGFMNKDFGQIFGSLNDGFMTMLGDMETGFKGFSAMLDGITMASVWGAVVGIGVKLLQGGFFNSEEAAPELGDSKRVSESLVNSLDNIYNVQYPMLALTRDMRGFLETISFSFGGIENSLLRSGLDLGGNLFQSSAKKGALFGGSTSDLYGTSIKVEAASVAELINGDLNAWTDLVTKNVKTKWYGASKTSYNHNITDISSSISEYISDATTSLFDSLTLAGKTLNIDTSRLKGMTIDIGKFDTTGMSESDIANELQGRFASEMDGITETLFSAVSEFQRGGEGLAETLYRVTVNFEQVSQSMELIGKSVDWRTANIIENVAGGLDALNTSLAAYTKSFFTDAEQYQMQVNTMAKNFDSLGIAMPQTNEDFRKLLESFDTTTDAGAVLFAEVIGLADGFNEMTSAAADLAEEAEQLAEEQSAEYIKLMEAEAEAIKKLSEEQSTSIKKMIKDVSDAWLGNLSYLTLQQKTDYASGYLAMASNSNGAINTVEAARLAAETALKSTTTKEEYIPIFERYISALQDDAPVATTDDVVARLDTLISRVQELEQTTARAAYQGVM